MFGTVFSQKKIRPAGLAIGFNVEKDNTSFEVEQKMPTAYRSLHVSSDYPFCFLLYWNIYLVLLPAKLRGITPKRMQVLFVFGGI